MIPQLPPRTTLKQSNWFTSSSLFYFLNLWALTSSWKKVVSVFVEGHGHDAVRQVKGFLHAVAVVNVDVDVENPGVVPESHVEMWRGRTETPGGDGGGTASHLTWAAPGCWWRCRWRSKIQTPEKTKVKVSEVVHKWVESQDQRSRNRIFFWMDATTTLSKVIQSVVDSSVNTRSEKPADTAWKYSSATVWVNVA